MVLPSPSIQSFYGYAKNDCSSSANPNTLAYVSPPVSTGATTTLQSTGDGHRQGSRNGYSASNDDSLGSIDGFNLSGSTLQHTSSSYNGSFANSDGFTREEVEAVLRPRPLTETWKPRGVYETVENIGDLIQGPGNIKLVGRIANFSTSKEIQDGHGHSLIPQGWHFLVVKDGTGVVAQSAARILTGTQIKLLATGTDHECLHLGALVTVWASFVGQYNTTSPERVPRVSAMITIHPAQGSSTCIKFHRELPGSNEKTLCRLPLDYNLPCPSSQVHGLMSLEAYLKSGFEGVSDPKLLICVSSIGPRKTFKSKSIQMIEVVVFDETKSCVLRLWQDKVASARTWVASETVLLITNPGFRPAKGKNSNPELRVDITSMVDVNPELPEAEWLRRLAAARTKQGRACIPFPKKIWDADVTANRPDHVVFTLAEIDERARADSGDLFCGMVALLVAGVNIAENYRTAKLCCSDCCGVALYSNRATAFCKHCMTERTLTLNPRNIGQLVDETGCIGPGKLVWSDKAWTELFFGNGSHQGDATCPANTEGDQKRNSGAEHSWTELTALNSDEIRSVEEQLRYSRIMLSFGWSSEVERLCVLGVKW